MKNLSKIYKIFVFNEDQRVRIFVGELIRIKDGYTFSYDAEYMSRASATPLGPDLPFSLEEIKSKFFFESLRDLIPSRDNPAYKEYCKSVGISIEEEDPMTLLAYLGKGPSNFIFEPASKDQLPSGKEVIDFRATLNLSQKQFANLLDIPLPTLQTLEQEKAEARSARRLIQIILETPTSLWKILQRRGFYLHSKQLAQVESFIRQEEEKVGNALFEKQKKYRQLGYLEVFHSLVSTEHHWDQLELLKAAENSKLPNTGWPIGVVLHTENGKPLFKKNGIEVAVESGFGSYDEWFLKRNGEYYFFRIFEEDRDTKPQKNNILYFDVRVWRIIEAILHCIKLYKALNVPSYELIDLHITHSGLQERKLTASNPLMAFTFLHRVCKERETTWQKRATLEDLEKNLLKYVLSVSEELFILFDGFKPTSESIEATYKTFTTSHLF